MENRLEYLLQLRDKVEAKGQFLSRTKQAELRRLLIERGPVAGSVERRNTLEYGEKESQ